MWFARMARARHRTRKRASRAGRAPSCISVLLFTLVLYVLHQQVPKRAALLRTGDTIGASYSAIRARSTSVLQAVVNRTNGTDQVARTVIEYGYVKLHKLDTFPWVHVREVHKVQLDVPGDESIFVARRKGVWMGCARAYFLVCKGVYRAIKRTASVNVMDVSCVQDLQWLPKVLDKLKDEFRMVRLTCAVRTHTDVKIAQEAFKMNPLVNVVMFDPFVEAFVNTSDMIIAYRLVENENLIRTMQFFKNVKKHDNVQYIVHDNYPQESNVITVHPQNNSRSLFRINAAREPFSFPEPVYIYENVDEQPGTHTMHIVCRSMRDIFERRTLPELQDLIDPRKRHAMH